MKFKKFLIEHKFEILIFVIIFMLMVPNFSNMYLWQDEGETAMLAKNIVLFGVPKTYDGKNLVTNSGKDFNSDFIWTWSSWMHLYITALSFSILGFSTFSARLPFVIIGLLSFFPIVLLFKKISINKMHYYLSILTLLFFIPYYLYSRQDRYYALLIFLMPVIIISIYNLSFKNGSIMWFAIPFALLFHSNYLSFFILMASASIYFCLAIFKNYVKQMKLLRKIIISYIIIFILTFPWALYTNIFEKINVKHNLIEWSLRKIDYVMHSINSTVPLLLIAISIFFMLFFCLRKNEVIKKQKQNFFFTFFNGITPIIILFFPTYSDVRYIIGLFPLWISFTIVPIVFLIHKKKFELKIIGLVIFLLLIFTNIFYSAGFYFFQPFEGALQEKCISFAHKKADYCKSWIKDVFINPKELKYPPFYYLYEITHDYDSPIEGIVKYLKLKGNKNSIVFANDRYFPIQFYTGMKVLNRVQYLDTSLIPDFIVVDSPNRRDIEKINYLISYAEARNYTKVTLPYQDLPWDNRPVMSYHKFWTQPIKIPVTIYIK